MRAAIFALLITCAAWCQTSAPPKAAWPKPVSFEVSNPEQMWAVIANLAGDISFNGSAVEVSIRHATLSRRERFDAPVEVRSIDASITRDGPGGQWDRVRLSPSHPISRSVAPGESIQLEPFTFRIPLGTLQLLKSDFITFGVEVTTVLANGTSGPGFVYAHLRLPLPVSQAGPAYCADQITDLRRSTSDSAGYQVTGYQVIEFCQDSAGRTRTATFFRPANSTANSSALPSSVRINDPVANVIYSLDSRNKQAVRSKGYTVGGVFGGVIGGILGAVPSPPGSPPVPQPKTETRYIGRKQIEGVTAIGSLATTVYPAGYQGRDREVTVTHESWYSYEIKTTVMSTQVDPRYGGGRFHLENIRVGDPDPALFTVPPDYQLTDR